MHLQPLAVGLVDLQTEPTDSQNFLPCFLPFTFLTSCLPSAGDVPYRCCTRSSGISQHPAGSVSLGDLFDSLSRTFRVRIGSLTQSVLFPDTQITAQVLLLYPTGSYRTTNPSVNPFQKNVLGKSSGGHASGSVIYTATTHSGRVRLPKRASVLAIGMASI